MELTNKDVMDWEKVIKISRSHAHFASPSGSLDNDSTYKRAHRAANRVHGEHDGNEVSTLTQWNEIRYDDIHDHVDATTSNSLNGASNDEHVRTICATTDAASQGEDGDDEHRQPSTTKDIR